LKRAGAYLEAGCEILHLPKIDLREVLRLLVRRGVLEVLIEGGGTVLASAFDARVVDEVLVFVAPKIIGGRQAITPVEGEGVCRVTDALHLTPFHVEWMNGVVIIKARP
jgi:diaminohydroxyphosphoribosylaminopyrimidine deaminase/5-amino-6-(5-phosphoribosylamino)uracil reductase